MSILNLLDINDGSKVAVVGCGGKTSLISLISNENIEKRVLVTTTTKIYPIIGDGVHFLGEDILAKNHVPQKGINCMGIYDESKGKLCQLSYTTLKYIINKYDIVLIEADGSRGLPCKGWEEYEPLVPDLVTHTIGVVTLGGLFMPATEKYVLRLPKFCDLTDLNYGDTITLDSIVKMLCGKDGMFKNAVGKKILFLNQIEDNKSEKLASQLIDKVVSEYPYLFSKIIYGSVKYNRFHVRI